MASSCELSPAEHEQLQQWLSAHGTPQQVALRCRIVLAASEGQSDVTIAERLSVNRKTVILWRSRFSEQRLEGLWEIAPGRGRKPIYDIDKIAAVVEATLQTKPAGMTHWSCRTMAQSQGVSKSTVNYIWQAHNLKPHLVETFKLSRDPKFLEKLTDVVGLYLNPPQQAIVLCVDEKSQIQALDRTQPGLPIKPGRCGTMTHDYKRNGTTTLFAALDVLGGKVIGRCMQRHRHQEFIRFLNAIEAETPVGKIIHVILDNYGPHKHPNKLARHYRESRWEPAELNGGKLSEIVYTILKGHVDGAFPATPSKPRNMVDACGALASANSFPRAIRIQIPRIIVALYEIRNNR